MDDAVSVAKLLYCIPLETEYLTRIGISDVGNILLVLTRKTSQR